MLKYSLFGTGRGFLENREPIKATDSIEVRITGHDGSAKAIIQNESSSPMYFDIKDGKFRIPCSIFAGKDGKVRLSITAYASLPKCLRWSCEGFGYICVNEDENVYLIYPAASDREAHFVELYGEVERVKAVIAELEKNQKQIKETVDIALVGFPTE